MRRTIALLAALLVMPAAAQAQAPSPAFAELASLLKTGETVSVTDNAGRIVKGRVQQVSDTILELRSNQGDLSLAAPDVQRIARPLHRVRNAALIGLAAGFVGGAVLAGSTRDDFVNFSNPAGVLLLGGFFGSIGMGIGAAVGAALPGERVVYERTVTGRARATMEPMLPRGGAGVLMQISW